MLLMGLVRFNVTTMLVMMHMRSHMLRVVLRLMVLRVMTVVFFVMLRHLDTP